MFILNLEFIARIKSATEKGQITWFNTEGFLCCETNFEDEKYIICKYPLDDENAFDVSFNKLNAFNNMVRPYREFSKGDMFYVELLELADIIWKNRNVIAA